MLAADVREPSAAVPYEFNTVSRAGDYVAVILDPQMEFTAGVFRIRQHYDNRIVATPQHILWAQILVLKKSEGFPVIAKNFRYGQITRQLQMHHALPRPRSLQVQGGRPFER